MTDVKQVQFKVDKPPVFAEEVFITPITKATKTKLATGFIRLQFADMRTSQIVADVVIDPVTCDALIAILKEKLDALTKVMKSSDPQKQIKRLIRQQPVKTSDKDEMVYTG